MENKPVTENLWRVWVDTRRRIVSFHEEEGSFHTQFLKAAFAVSMIKTMKRPVLFQLFLKNFCLLNGFPRLCGTLFPKIQNQNRQIHGRSPLILPILPAP